jgi:hypothetical protein
VLAIPVLKGLLCGFAVKIRAQTWIIKEAVEMGYATGYLCATLLIGALGFFLIRSGLKFVRKESSKKARGWLSLALGILLILATLLNAVRFLAGG